MIERFFENTKSNWIVYFKRINFIVSELCLNKVKKAKVAQRVVADSLWLHEICSLPGSSVHGIFQARILEWVAVPFSRGSSQSRVRIQAGLLNCRQILYCLSHLGSPRILEWVVYPFLRDSSWPRNQNKVLLHCWWILYQQSYHGSSISQKVNISLLFLKGRKKTYEYAHHIDGPNNGSSTKIKEK